MDANKQLRDEVQELLKSVPGPSPWYLRSFGPKIQTKFGHTFWTIAGDGPSLGGKTVLHTEHKKNLAIFGFYQWVWGIENQFLVSRSQSRVENGPTQPVKISVYDPNRFEAFESVSNVCQEMDAEKIVIYQKNGVIASIDVPSVVVGETRSLEFPEPLSRIDEILLLCDSSGLSVEGPNLALLALRPSEGTYQIIPQDWFNNGNYDFGYQWVTRIFRHPRTGRIFGDGIRLGGFMLDQKARNVEKWL